jgi:hypothetical protein
MPKCICGHQRVCANPPFLTSPSSVGGLQECLPRRPRSLQRALANPTEEPAYTRRNQQDRNRIAPDHGNGVVEYGRVPVPAHAAEHVFDHAGGGEPVLDPVDGEIQMSPALLDVPLDSLID